MTVEHITFDDVIHTLNTYKKSLIGVLIGFVIILAEKSIEDYVYACPCDPDFRSLYATQFIVIPTILFFVAGIALKTNTWKLVSGRCKKKRSNVKSDQNDQQFLQPQSRQQGSLSADPPQANLSQAESSQAQSTQAQSSQASSSQANSPQTDSSKEKNNSCRSCTGWINLYNNFAFVLIAPLIWVVLIVLDGDYLACAHAKEVYQNESREVCNPKETPYTDFYRNQRHLSQVIGWFLAGGLSVLALILHMVVRGCSSISYPEREFELDYERIIEETIKEEHRDVMKRIAKENQLTKSELQQLWNSNYQKFVNQKTILRQGAWKQLSTRTNEKYAVGQENPSFQENCGGAQNLEKPTSKSNCTNKANAQNNESVNSPLIIIEKPNLTRSSGNSHDKKRNGHQEKSRINPNSTNKANAQNNENDTSTSKSTNSAKICNKKGNVRQSQPSSNRSPKFLKKTPKKETMNDHYPLALMSKDESVEHTPLLMENS